jgi:hypothetical protein
VLAAVAPAAAAAAIAATTNTATATTTTYCCCLPHFRRSRTSTLATARTDSLVNLPLCLHASTTSQPLHHHHPGKPHLSTPSRFQLLLRSHSCSTCARLHPRPFSTPALAPSPSPSQSPPSRSPSWSSFTLLAVPSSAVVCRSTNTRCRCVLFLHAAWIRHLTATAVTEKKLTGTAPSRRRRRGSKVP